MKNAANVKADSCFGEDTLELLRQDRITLANLLIPFTTEVPEGLEPLTGGLPWCLFFSESKI